MDPAAALGSNPSATQPKLFKSEKLEAIGKLFFSIGLIFASTPLWSYYGVVAVPAPLLITIGGVALAALGIVILLKNRTDFKAKKQDTRPTEEILEDNLEKAQGQIIEDNRLPAGGCNTEVYVIKSEKEEIFESNINAITTSVMSKTPPPFKSFTYNIIEFKNNRSKNKVNYEGVVFTVMSKIKKDVNVPLIQKGFLSLLTQQLNSIEVELSIDNIFQSIKTTFAQFQKNYQKTKIEGEISLIVAFVLGERLWIANTGLNRSFFISDSMLNKYKLQDASHKTDDLEELDEALEGDDKKWNTFMDRSFPNQPSPNKPIYPQGLSINTNSFEPMITSIFLDKPGYLVLASEGFYYSETMLRSFLEKTEQKASNELAEQLAKINHEERAKTCNTTIMTIRITEKFLNLLHENWVKATSKTLETAPAAT